MHCFGRSLRGAVRLRCAPAGLVSWQCRLVSRLCGVSARPGHPSLPARVTSTLIGICFPWKTLLREFWRAAQASSAQSFGTRTARNERRPAPPPHRFSRGFWFGVGDLLFSPSRPGDFPQLLPGSFSTPTAASLELLGGTPLGHGRRDGGRRSREEPALLGCGEDAQSQNENAEEMRERLTAFPSPVPGGRRLPDPGHSGRSQGAPSGGC